MPASSSSTLSLAGRLRQLGDPELEQLITARAIRDSGIRDFFDLADALLDSESVQRALTRLDRITLAALAAAGETGADASTITTDEVAARLAGFGSRAADVADVAGSLAEAHERALIGREGDRWISYRPVTDQLRSWPSLGLPDARELAAEPAPAGLEPAAPADGAVTERTAGERAFRTTSVVAELLAELQLEPARELTRGGIALPHTKRLAATMSVELDEVAIYVSIAARADLVALDDEGWLPTAAAEEWLLLPASERWGRLAGAWLARMPASIRGLLSERAYAIWGARLAEHLAWLYPAGGEWMRDRSFVYTRDAELLGITANQVPSTAGTALLSAGVDAALPAMAALLPAEIDRVYVQHDLSIVSPGPLRAELDARVRRIADVENRALATTYRMTESSLSRAMAAGETADSLRAFLGEISLTGIPQPLDYLITTTAARHGLLRVGELDPEAPSPDTAEYGARSYLRSDEASILDTVLVDQNLTGLAITRIGKHRAVSRFERDVVFWSLIDARYPVAAENELGEIVVPARRRIAKGRPVAAEPASASIIRKLRFAGAPSTADTGIAWLERQLDTAARNKLAVIVTVKMPDGSHVDLQLEPASVGGGRLRARDRNSDLERTLPLTSITGVRPAE